MLLKISIKPHSNNEVCYFHNNSFRLWSPRSFRSHFYGSPPKRRNRALGSSAQESLPIFFNRTVHVCCFIVCLLGASPHVTRTLPSWAALNASGKRASLRRVVLPGGRGAQIEFFGDFSAARPHVRMPESDIFVLKFEICFGFLIKKCPDISQNDKNKISYLQFLSYPILRRNKSRKGDKV